MAYGNPADSTPPPRRKKKRQSDAAYYGLNKADHDRLIPALLEIQHSAGHLPDFVPGNIRYRVNAIVSIRLQLVSVTDIVYVNACGIVDGDIWKPGAAWRGKKTAY